MRNENEDITTETEWIHKIHLKNKSLYSTKLENLDEIDDFYRHIPGTKVKSRSAKLSIQFYNQ